MLLKAIQPRLCQLPYRPQTDEYQASRIPSNDLFLVHQLQEDVRYSHAMMLSQIAGTTLVKTKFSPRFGKVVHIDNLTTHIRSD